MLITKKLKAAVRVDGNTLRKSFEGQCDPRVNAQFACATYWGLYAKYEEPRPKRNRHRPTNCRYTIAKGVI